MMDTCCRSSRIGVVVLLLAVLPAGCRRGEVLGRVYGKVTFQGKPVTEGVVLFDNWEKGVHMTAELDGQGAYEVEMAKGFGLPLGQYEVSVNPPLADTPPVGPILTPPKFREFPNIPKKYRDPKTSGLVLTVKEGDNPFDIDMRP